MEKTESATLAPDIVWVRKNGQAVEIRDMNEYHARAALRQMINAVASCDLEEAWSHILGAE